MSTAGFSRARLARLHGSDGGLGTSWHAEPREGMLGILMTQRAWTSPNPPPIRRDFWTLAYQALED